MHATLATLSNQDFHCLHNGQESESSSHSVNVSAIPGLKKDPKEVYNQHNTECASIILPLQYYMVT